MDWGETVGLEGSTGHWALRSEGREEGETRCDGWYVGLSVNEGGRRLIWIAGANNSQTKPIPKIVQGLNEDDVQQSIGEETTNETMG